MREREVDRLDDSKRTAPGPRGAGARRVAHDRRTRVADRAGRVRRDHAVRAGRDAVAAGRRTGLPGHELSGLPGRQRLEHADHVTPGRRRQRDLARVDVVGDDVPAPGLRPLGRSPRALRDPVDGRSQGHRVHARDVPVRLGEQPSSVPADGVDARRRGIGPSRVDARPVPFGLLGAVHALRDLRHLLPPERPIDRRVGRDVEPAIELAATGRLHLRRRRRPADPARTRQLQRGRRARDGPRDPLHGRLHPSVVRVAGATRGRPGRSVMSADGRAIPTERVLHAARVPVLEPSARPCSRR